MKKLLLLLATFSVASTLLAQTAVEIKSQTEGTNNVQLETYSASDYKLTKINSVGMLQNAAINAVVKSSVDDSTNLPLSPNGKLLSVDGFEVDFIVPTKPEIRNICYTPTPIVNGAPKSAGCPFTVPCDDPSNRDVSSYTTLKYVKLVWHVMLDGGASTNINQARIDDLMTELNADYAAYNVIFCTDPASFYEDAANYQHDSNTEEWQLKDLYNVTPTEVVNIYVVGDMTAGGYARFPYDPNGGTNSRGGIVLNRGNCTVGTHTLAHEMGHTFGLEHTFAGVDERTQCASCYEQVRNVNGSSNTSGVATPLGGPYLNEGDREGDWCSDTNPHDTYSYNCSTSANANGGCDLGPWANAPVNNHMSYSFCSSQFTNQQNRRMHCMIDSYLGSWTSYAGGICGALPPVADFVGTPTTWQAPSNVNFTDLSTPQAIITGWTWKFDVAAGGTVTCVGCTGADATFVGQVPPAVTYPNPGLYTVSLTITSANGPDTETKIDYIEVLAPAGDCDTLDGQWITPISSPSIYTFGGGYLTGVQDPTNSTSPTDLKGMYEMFFTPNPGVTQVGAVRVGLGLLNDVNDNMTFQVVIFDDDGAGAPGAVLGGVGGLSPTQMGVPTGSSFAEFWIPLNNAVTPTTGTFHVGVEITPGDATDSMIVISSAAGEGEGDNSNHIWTTNFGYENLQAAYGIDFDLDIIPMLGEYAPLPLITGYTENVVCDTTYVTIFDTALYSSVSSWSFTFADGTVINSTTDPMSIDRVYTSPGPDTVTIAVINDCGRGDTNTYVIPYGFLSTPDAEFSATPLNPVCMGVPGIDFTADIAGYVDYSWDFGDGSGIVSSGNTETINHVYTAPGSYYVELTTTEAGYLAADTFYLENFELGWPVGYDRYDNDPFTPNAGVNPPFDGTNATAWLPLDADNDGDGEAASTSWNGGPGQPADDWMLTTGIGALPVNQRLFWDGEALDVNFPDGYEVRISTTQLPANVTNYNTLLFSTSAENAFPTTRSVDLSSYAGLTVFIAFRNVSDDQFLISIDNIRVGTATAGCVASILKTDYIEIIDCSIIPPTTVLNADVTSGCDPLTVTFTDATVAGDPADSWLWNFGDGTFSLVQNPVPHVYNIGSYFVVFESCNGGGCTQDTVTIVVGSPATITSVNIIEPTCAGNDGAITINATGGTGTLQYSIDNGATFQPGNNFTGLVAGTYDVIVEDAIGCQVATTTTLTGLPLPTITGTIVTDVLCNGSLTGDITVTATGGTGTIQYSLDGVTFQVSNVFSGLAAGAYTVTIQDANGCQDVSAVINITEPVTAVSIAGVASNDPSCNGVNDGDITITATGGTGILQYSIDNGVTFQAGNSFTTLLAGSYNIIVEDVNGCQAMSSVTLTDPIAVSIVSVTPVDPSCIGNDGTIAISATGGTGTLQYSIDNGVTFQAGNSFAGLSGGTYNIVVEDANGCQDVSSTTLTVTSSPTITTVTSNDPLCNGANDGDITITATGGTGTLQYSIDNGVTFQAGNSFAGLSGGTYNIVVEDVNGCQAMSSITLTDPTGVSISNISTTDPTCAGNDGDITITAAGGTGTLQYSIDNGVTFQAGNIFNTLGGGTFNVVVEDANGCQDISTAVLTATGGPVISSVTFNDPTCNGLNDGDVTIAATGTATLQYSIDNGVTFQVGNNFAGVGAGIYNVVVEDGLACQTTSSVTLTDPIAVSITGVVTNDPSCNAGTDGDITITASGGTGTLQYSIDNGITFQAGNSFSGLSAGTFNIVVEDVNGCQATQTGTLTDPAMITYTVTVVDENCGLADGSIDVTGVAGGSGAGFQYSIDNGVTFQASGTFTGLVVNSYNVVVEDGLGCQSTSVETVNGTGGPSITNINEDLSILCNGDCNGQLTGTVTGGTLPYQFDWTDGVNNPVGTNNATVSGLCADIYTLTVTDNGGAGCPTILTYTILEPTVITYASSFTDETCGSANGTIDLTAVSGGSGAGYQYSIDNGATFQGTGSFSGLVANIYNVVVADGNGCTVSSTVTVSNIAGAIITGVVTNDPTCGAMNGDITITATGGTGTLQYSIDNGITFQAGNNFTGLGTGTFNVVVEDANLCQTTTVATLTDLGSPVIGSVTPTDATCGNSNGDITITATGGTGTLQYSIDNGITFQPGGVFNGLIDATYLIVVMDASGCQVSQTQVITNTIPPTITVVTSNDPTCGANNGDITITASGGTGTLQYSIDNGATFQASNSFTGLTAGTFNVVVEDAVGCSVTGAEILTATASPSIGGVVLNDPTCGNNNGDVTVTATGGFGTLQYSVNNGVTFQPANNFTGLGTGTYNIIVEDANGCQDATTSTLVDAGPPVIGTVNTTNPSCGSPNGGLIIPATGGTGTIQYSIDNGATFQVSNSFTGLAATTYNIVVEDANGCQDNTTALLVDAGSPTITTVSSTDASCGSNNGLISISVSGGAGATQYSIDNGVTFSFSSNFTGLAPGNYPIVVQDANGCSANSTATIVQTGSPVITIDNIVDLVCFGDANGQVNITVTGGASPYTFDWSNDGSGDFDDPEDLATGVPGVVSVTVLDNAGCSDLITATINGPGDLTAVGIATDAAFGNDGSIDLTVTGGTAPYTFAWSNGATNEDPTGLAGNTTYQVVVTDSRGCTFTLDVFVGSVVGISELENPMEINVYPNPNNGEFYINFENYSGDVTVEVLDVTGKLILVSMKLVQSDIPMNIDLGTVSNGVYFVSISGDFDTYAVRVVKY